MTRVDFYILQSAEEQARLELAYKLCEKAYTQNMQVMIWSATQAQADQLDQLMWQYRPESFMPHCQLNKPLPNTSVVISTGQDDLSHHGLMINLSNTVPEHFSRFQRMAELVIQKKEILDATRQHYGFFKDRGYPLNTHKL